MVDLLAGAGAIAKTWRRATPIKQELFRILEAQRIVSLDTLFQLADKLEGGNEVEPGAV